MRLWSLFVIHLPLSVIGVGEQNLGLTGVDFLTCLPIKSLDLVRISPDYSLDRTF